MPYPRQAHSFVSGQQAVTASAVALATCCVVEAVVKADPTNAIPIYVGGSGVTTSTGFRLDPGDTWVPNVDNLNQIYVVASTTGASVSWVGKA